MRNGLDPCDEYRSLRSSESKDSTAAPTMGRQRSPPLKSPDEMYPRTSRSTTKGPMGAAWTSRVTSLRLSYSASCSPTIWQMTVSRPTPVLTNELIRGDATAWPLFTMNGCMRSKNVAAALTPSTFVILPTIIVVPLFREDQRGF